MSSSPRANAKNRTQGDPADELRRRARRRLVGAVVLFLFALLVVPALIQPGPETPSDPIELVIPQRPASSALDNTSNSTPENTATPPSETAPLVLPPKVKATPQLSPEQATENTPEKTADKPLAKPTEKPAQKPVNKTAEKPQKAEKLAEKTAEKNSNKNTEKPAAKKPVPTDEDPIGRFADETMGQKNLARAQAQAQEEVSATPAAAKTKHWVQVAAVGDNDRARALRDQLASKGFSARVEATQSSGATVYRVRVGPFASADKADETKSSLSKLGFQGRVVQ